jgi:DNA-binding NtrC family response regulator
MIDMEREEPRVLVVDDEQSIRDASTRILLDEGYQVDSAPDGEAALEMAARMRPDLVLLDLKMPGLGGLAVLDDLNQLVPGAVKVIVTAYATVSTAVEAMRHGASDFLPKPFTPDEMRATAKRGLKRQRMLRERGQAQQRFLELVGGKLQQPLADAHTDLGRLAAQLEAHSPEQELAKKALARLEVLLSLAEKWETP